MLVLAIFIKVGSNGQQIQTNQLNIMNAGAHANLLI